jgi:hypothetical protein
MWKIPNPECLRKARAPIMNPDWQEREDGRSFFLVGWVLGFEGSMQWSRIRNRNPEAISALGVPQDTVIRDNPYPPSRGFI